jgi:hypothetical protein
MEQHWFWLRSPVSPTQQASIVTETGNDNSANIMQTGDKHVSEVTQDGHNYGFGGYKTKRMLRTKKAVIGSHGDKNMAKIVQKTDSI